jgi:DNA modification methylase
MPVHEQLIADTHALYLGDCVEVLRDWPAGSVDLSIYSPPFGGLYQYSSDPRDLSNCLTREEFFEHYDHVIRALHRVTKPGRLSMVHCMDIPTGNTGLDSAYDFPGDIIRHHEAHGWSFCHRRMIWKEPLTVRNRTMTKTLHHKTLTLDSSRTSIAHADQLLTFRRSGTNAVPVEHPVGLTDYAGERRPPAEVLPYRGWTGSQLENRYSHWVWRQYASAFWDDIRIDEVLPHKPARGDGDERHVHPLQLDVITRAVVLGSNPGEVVLTPFMGVGSEVYAAILQGRRAIGIELKASYYRQAVRNIEAAVAQLRDAKPSDQADMFGAETAAARP